MYKFKKLKNKNVYNKYINRIDDVKFVKIFKKRLKCGLKTAMKKFIYFKFKCNEIKFYVKNISLHRKML